MLIKIKPQGSLSATPLNTNNSLIKASITRNGVATTFDVSTTTLKFQLYPFETISNVVLEKASTSTIQTVVTNATTGNIIITAEDNSQKTYGYTIEALSYTNGLPIITAVSSTAGTSSIITPPANQSILGQVWNIGTIARRDANQINAVTVQDGGWSLLSVVGDYDATERTHLFNGADVYLKTWRTIDAGGTNYVKMVYYKIVENASLFPAAVTPTPAKIVYQNQIGYLNFDVFVPLTTGLSVENIYNKASKTDLTTYLTGSTITHYTPVTWTEVDATYETSATRDLTWNANSDKGFSKEDVLNLNKTLSTKIQQVITRDFEPAWTTFKTGKTFASTELELVAKLRYRVVWLQEQKLDAVWEYLDYVTLGESGINEDAIKGTSKKQYIVDLKKSFIIQLTYGWMLQKFNENDVTFFINRLTYFESILSSYKSSSTKDDVVGMKAIFLAIQDVIRTRLVSGVASATANMTLNLKKFTDKLHVLVLTNPF